MFVSRRLGRRKRLVEGETKRKYSVIFKDFVEMNVKLKHNTVSVGTCQPTVISTDTSPLLTATYKRQLLLVSNVTVTRGTFGGEAVLVEEVRDQCNHDDMMRVSY